MQGYNMSKSRLDRVWEYYSSYCSLWLNLSNRAGQWAHIRFPCKSSSFGLVWIQQSNSDVDQNNKWTLVQYVCGMNAIWLKCSEHCASLKQTRIRSLQRCACPLFAWHEATHCSQDIALKCFQRCHFARVSMFDIQCGPSDCRNYEILRVHSEWCGISRNKILLPLPAKTMWFVTNEQAISLT